MNGWRIKLKRVVIESAPMVLQCISHIFPLSKMQDVFNFLVGIRESNKERVDAINDEVGSQVKWRKTVAPTEVERIEALSAKVIL